MALRGSLADLNVVELIQVPAAGGKTGELLIACHEADARLYFRDGRLVHAVMGELAGQQVLTEIVGWDEGEFEFRPEMTTDGATIEEDVNRAIMLALREREGLPAGADGDEDDDGPAEAALKHRLDQWMASYDFLLDSCIFNREGSVVAYGGAGEAAFNGLGRLRHSLCELSRTYPRPELHRVLLEDEHGTIVIVCLPEGMALMVVADRNATLGAVSVCVERFARGLRIGRRGV